MIPRFIANRRCGAVFGMTYHSGGFENDIDHLSEAATVKLGRHLTLISAVLFTIALLATIPTSIHMAAVLPHRTPAPLYYWQLEPIGELGITSLAVVAVGLIVIWTEYLRNSKSAWFVLLVIAFGWAFPVRLLQFIVGVEKVILKKCS